MKFLPLVLLAALATPVMAEPVTCKADDLAKAPLSCKMVAMTLSGLPWQEITLDFDKEPHDISKDNDESATNAAVMHWNSQWDVQP